MTACGISSGCVLALVAALGLSPCDEEERGSPPTSTAPQVACTRAGCGGGVDVRLRGVPREAASVRACVLGHCAEVGGERPRIVHVPLPQEDRAGGPSERTARVRVAARDSAGRVLARRSVAARLTALRPNGRRCTPTCWGGEVTARLHSP